MYLSDFEGSVIVVSTLNLVYLIYEWPCSASDCQFFVHANYYKITRLSERKVVNKYPIVVLPYLDLMSGTEERKVSAMERLDQPIS